MPQNDQSLLPDNTMDTRQLMGADSDETEDRKSVV